MVNRNVSEEWLEQIKSAINELKNSSRKQTDFNELLACATGILAVGVLYDLFLKDRIAANPYALIISSVILGFALIILMVRFILIIWILAFKRKRY
ncbi:MAG: hypothetical protein ABIH63_04410 [archaeon]